MRLGELLRLTVRTTAFVVNTLGCWVCLELIAFFGRRPRIDVVTCWLSRWARFGLRIYGVRVSCRGALPDNKKRYPARGPNGVGRIFVMNHRSGMDILVILSLVEAHVISRHDLADWPFLGRLAKRVGTLFVDRSSKRSGASVLKAVSEALEAGEGVAMFPEGTAFVGDEVREFRPGAFNSARRAGAEVIPLGIAYDNDAAYYRQESFLSHLKRVGALAKLNVAIEVGQPIAVVNQDTVEMKDRVREEVQCLVNRCRARLKSKSRL